MEALLLLTLSAIPWTELASIATAFSVIVTAYLANKKRTNIADAQTAKSNEIHVLVNSRLQQALDRIRQLEVALGIGEGAPIPK